MLAWQFIYGLWDNNEQEPILTETSGTKIIKLWNFSGRFQFKLWHFASRLEYVYTFDTEKYCLDVNYKVSDARALKNLYHHCSFIWRFEIATHVCWGIYLRLTKIRLTQCCVSSDLIDRIWNYTYVILDQFHWAKANKFPKLEQTTLNQENPRRH